MIQFECPTCSKGLRVKPELTGKRVKCPKCGQGVMVPAETASPVPAGNSGDDLPDERTRAPKETSLPGNLDAATMPPANNRTVAQEPKSDTNPGNKPDATNDGDAEDIQSLTDFLAPPQQPDEIGRLGTYRILKVLGAGGMGVVYKAEDPGLERFVAVKAMLPTIAASASAKKRFLREARAAAGIKHNHIVTIFQVGEDRGIPYLAMEFLEGEPLDERLKRENILPLPDVMRIGREMAEGMSAAHERGLIHRDIKPGNTWLEASPGRKSGDYHVKILDFGLARQATDDAHLTQSGAIVGTPAYMAPEQGRGEKLDARCDLWSLGVVLYRMSTGQVPFKGADTVSTLMAVALNNPSPPTQVNAEIPAGLSDLIMKLLEKDPAKRIGSAHEVAEALREMEHQQKTIQVTAKPIAKTAKTQQVVGAQALAGPKNRQKTQPQQAAESGGSRRKSRKPLVLALAGGLAAALIAVIVFFWPTSGGVIRVEINDPKIEVVFTQNELKIKGADKQTIKVTPDKQVGLHVQRGDFGFDTNNLILKNGETITLKIEWLQEGKLQVVRGDKVIAAKEFPKKIEVAVAPPPEPQLASIARKFEGHTLSVFGAAMSADCQRVVSGSWDKTAILWDAANGKKLKTLTLPDVLYSVGISGDSKYVITGSRDHTVCLWEADTAKKLHTFPCEGFGAISNDGKRVFTGMALWNTADGKQVQSFNAHPGRWILSVAISGDGKYVATGSDDKTAALWDANTGKNIQTFHGHTELIHGVAVSGDGKRVLSGSYDKTAILWDADTGKKIRTFEGNAGRLVGVALSEDGKLALIGGEDTKAILWDTDTGKKLQVLKGHTSTIRTVALSSDAKHFLTGCNDNTAILWELKPAPTPVAVRSDPFVQKFQGGHTDTIKSVALSGDGKYALTGSDDKTAILWDPASGKKIQTLKGHTATVVGAALSADGKHALTGSGDNTAVFWDAIGGKKLQIFQGLGAAVTSVALSGDAKLAVTGMWDNKAYLWNASDGKKVQTFVGHNGSVTSVYLSANGKYVATGSGGGDAKLWDPANGKTLQTFDGHVAAVVSVAVSDDGKRFLTGSWDHTAILWDAANAKKLQTFRHASGITGVALSSDGKRVITSSWDKSVIVWDAASGKELQSFQGHTGEIWGLALSGDGRRVLTGSEDKTAILWEVKAPPLVAGAKFTNSLGMEFALVPKGKSWLGGGSGQVGPNEVNMRQDFYLGVYEVTQKDWQKVMGNNPSHFSRERVGKEISDDELKRFPVENITWDAAKEFVRLVNDKVKQDAKEAGWEYRLPTEEQWEYACRGGTMTDKSESAFDYYFEKPTNALAKENCNFEGSDVKRPRAVGSYLPNRLGLYDMHGNVWEWCEDRYDKEVAKRVGRGGGWGQVSMHCRAATRDWFMSSKEYSGVGLRLARISNGAPSPEPLTASMVQKFDGDVGAVNCVALSHNGKYVLTGAKNWTAILWDAAAGKKLKAFLGHTDAISSVALSADSKKVLTGSSDKTAILWDAASGEKIQTFQGHNDGVTSVALSGDAKRVLTGSLDKTVILWDAAGAKKIHTFRHTKGITCVAFSGNATRVLTGGEDRIAILWDAASGEKLQIFTGHTVTIRGVAISGDGKHVVTASEDGTAILWEAAGGNRLKTFQGHAGGIWSVAFSSDGKRVLTGSQDKTAILWDASSGKKLQTFQGHTGWVVGVAFSGDGKRVLTGSWDKTAILWEVNASPSATAVWTPRTIAEWTIRRGGKVWIGNNANIIAKIDQLPVGNFKVARVILSNIGLKETDLTAITSWTGLNIGGLELTRTGLTDEGLRLLAKRGPEFDALECSENAITGIGFDAWGDRPVVALTFANCPNINAAGWKSIANLKGQLQGLWFIGSPLTDSALAEIVHRHPELPYLEASYTPLTDAALDDLQKLTKLLTLDLAHTAIGDAALPKLAKMTQLQQVNLKSTKVSAKGIEGLRKALPKCNIFWDDPAPTPTSMAQKFEGHSDGVRCAAVSWDGKRALTGARDNTAILWDSSNGKKIQTFQGHTGSVEAVALSKDGQHVFTASRDKTAIQWDAASGKKIRTFEGHTADVWCMVLSADGKHILTGSGDKTAILWEIAGGKKIQIFQGDTDVISCVAISGDGKHIVTGSTDGTATLWETASGKQLHTFLGHASHVYCVAMSGDGKVVLTGSEDRTAILWDAAGGKKLQTFQGHTAGIARVALSGDGKVVVTASGDNTAALWDAGSGKKLQTFQGHTAIVWGVALSGDGRYVLTGSFDNTAILWQINPQERR